jgi:hypothetical protein
VELDVEADLGDFAAVPKGPGTDAISADPLGATIVKQPATARITFWSAKAMPAAAKPSVVTRAAIRW